MKKTETALRKVAEENGVSVEEVRREIQAIIDDLYKRESCSPCSSGISQNGT